VWECVGLGTYKQKKMKIFQTGAFGVSGRSLVFNDRCLRAPSKEKRRVAKKKANLDILETSGGKKKITAGSLWTCTGSKWLKDTLTKKG